MSQQFGLSIALKDLALEPSLSLYVLNVGIHWNHGNDVFNDSPDEMVSVYIAMSPDDVHKYQANKFFIEHTNKYATNTLLMKYTQHDFSFTDNPVAVDISTLERQSSAHFDWVSPASYLPKEGDVIETYHSECGGKIEVIEMTPDALENFICFWETKGCKAWRNIQLPDGSKHAIFEPTGNMASKDMPF